MWGQITEIINYIPVVFCWGAFRYLIHSFSLTHTRVHLLHRPSPIYHLLYFPERQLLLPLLHRETCGYMSPQFVPAPRYLCNSFGGSHVVGKSSIVWWARGLNQGRLRVRLTHSVFSFVVWVLEAAGANQSSVMNNSHHDLGKKKKSAHHWWRAPNCMNIR